MREPTLYFTRDEYAARIAKTRAAMQAKGLDLIIVSDPSNMAWLTGYDGWSFYVHQGVLLGLEGDPVWFGRGQDANGALRTCFMKPDDIIGYPDNYVQSTERHPMDFLSARIEDRGWAKAEELANWYVEELGKNGMTVGPAGDALKSDFQKIGETMTSEWLAKAGDTGKAAIDAYKAN